MEQGRESYEGGGHYGERYPEGGYRRATGKRPVTDYGCSMVQWMRHRRPIALGAVAMEVERPSASYIVDMLPPAARPGKAVDTIPAKNLHTSQNRLKHPINVVLWTAEGRRCLTCSSDGEFTLWNGMAFNFETILRAHDSAIRSAVYSHNEEWLISADHDGVVKFWQPNFNNVRQIQAHDDAIRDLAFAPNDERFVTACDDHTMKIYPFAADRAESVLTGHNWDVKTVDWHPTKGLLASGSKDHQVKLWDPRSGRCLTTLHGHKNTISKVRFDPHRGHLLATCARDQTARVFDIRMMRDVCLLRGYEPRSLEQRPGQEREREASAACVAWHPIHSSLLSIGGTDGSIFHYLLDEPNTPTAATTNTAAGASIPPYDAPDPANAPAQTIYPAHRVPHAHQWAVWSLAWHPLGHILASGSNDRTTRFWTRPRPGDTSYKTDIYYLGARSAEASGMYDRRRGRQEMLDAEEQELQDEAEGLVDQTMPAMPNLPGLPQAGATGMANGYGAPAGVLSSMGQNNVNGHTASGEAAFPPPPVPYAAASSFPGMDPQRYSALMAQGSITVPPPPIPPPPLGQNGYGNPLAGQNGALPPPLPPNFDLSKVPPELRAQLPFPLPVPPAGSNYGSGAAPPPPPPPYNAGSGMPGLASMSVGSTDGSGDMNGGAGRRRSPLPSQKDSMAEEQRRGSYR